MLSRKQRGILRIKAQQSESQSTRTRESNDNDKDNDSDGIGEERWKGYNDEKSSNPEGGKESNNRAVTTAATTRFRRLTYRPLLHRIRQRIEAFVVVAEEEAKLPLKVHPDCT